MIYRRREPETVRAIQYDGTNARDVAELLGMKLDGNVVGADASFNVDPVGQVAWPGVWVCLHDNGTIQLCSDEEFRSQFVEGQ